MPEIIDDKSEHCIPFILEQLELHRKKHADKADPPPFFIGMNGVQGAGKTTLVSAISSTLSSRPYSLPTVILSIDDLYLPHSAQVALASSHPDNVLVQHRGEPGTHDMPLAVALFSDLKSHNPTRVPAYDKSAFSGQGDRAPESTWLTVNSPGTQRIEAVLFEGWCVGFRALGNEEVKESWENAKKTKKGTLWKHELEHLLFVNEKLREYDGMTDALDAFIHIDAEDTQFVYDWRIQQEVALREAKWTGMTDEQVIEFVDGYYPAYELFTASLRRGVFKEAGKQLRLIVGKDRRVKEVSKI